MAAKPRRPIPAATFCRYFGQYKDEAIENGYVEVSSNGRPSGAYLSQKEFERFQKLRRIEDLSENQTR